MSMKTMARNRISLNGEWKYCVNGGPEEVKNVPFSALCVGKSTCSLKFHVNGAVIKDKKPLLVFEGIAYKADAFLNGKQIGTMLPYCKYVFDVAKNISPGENTLSVNIYDMGVPFGPSEGWENYGGIIREVYLEFAAPVRIEDVFWKTKFNKGYSET
jgi:beta-galactosidase/beta-glucuronidase